MNSTVALTQRQSLPAEQRSRSPLPNLEPFLAVERLSASCGRRLRRVSWPIVPMASSWREESPEEKAQADSAVRAALVEQESAWPTVEMTTGLIAEITAALDAPPSKSITQTAVALMLDTRTRLPPNPALFLEVATRDLLELGFQPAIVVAACEHLRREARFMPEIAEIIEACRAIQIRYRRLRIDAEAAIPILQRAAETLAVEGPLPGTGAREVRAIPHR